MEQESKMHQIAEYCMDKESLGHATTHHPGHSQTKAQKDLKEKKGNVTTTYRVRLRLVG